MADRLFTDPALQEAYRALMREPVGTHLDEATWETLAAGALDEERRSAAFDHVTGCETCAGIWRGVLALQQDAAEQQLIDRPPATRRFPVAGWMAAAAVLVIGIAGVVIMRQAPPDTSVNRSTTTEATVEGLMMAYSADSVPTLVWTPVPGATRYRVELFTDDGRPVWERETASPPLGWPGDEPRAKGAYRWRVEAFDGETLLARSRLAPMELAR